jgi:hypothetical protein
MVMRGQVTWSPTEPFKTMSSQVHPSSISMAERPEMMPPVGTERAAVIPLARVTGMISLPGLTDTSARTFGLMRPTSLVSRVPRTDPISVSPMEVYALISPG